MKRIFLAICGCLMAGPVFADTIYGEDREVLYIGSRAGVAFAGETDFQSGATRVTQDYDLGYTAGGFVGFGSEITGEIGIRAEFEINTTRATVDAHSAPGFAFSGSTGKTRQFGAYFNFFLDYEVAPDLVLFGGAGAGPATLRFQEHGVTAFPTLLDESDRGVGYQFMTGVAYEAAEAVTLELMYRYQDIAMVELTGIAGTPSKVDFGTHSAMFGMRIGM